MIDPTSKTPPKRPRNDDLRDQHKPLSVEEQLEVGLEDSMDASDPPAMVAPGNDHHAEPASSTGKGGQKKNR